MKKRKTPFIHRNSIKKAVHDAGLRSSVEFEATLDEIMAIQISQACASAVKQGKRTLRREMLTTLFT